MPDIAISSEDSLQSAQAISIFKGQSLTQPILQTTQERTCFPQKYIAENVRKKALYTSYSIKKAA